MSYKYDNGSSYTQREGYDRYRNVGNDGHTTDRGRALYNDDGSMKRLDHYSVNGDGTHGHTWLKERDDGSWEYNYERHEDH